MHQIFRRNEEIGTKPERQTSMSTLKRLWSTNYSPELNYLKKLFTSSIMQIQQIIIEKLTNFEFCVQTETIFCKKSEV